MHISGFPVQTSGNFVPPLDGDIVIVFPTFKAGEVGNS